MHATLFCCRVTRGVDAGAGLRSRRMGRGERREVDSATRRDWRAGASLRVRRPETLNCFWRAARLATAYSMLLGCWSAGLTAGPSRCWVGDLRSLELIRQATNWRGHLNCDNRLIPAWIDDMPPPVRAPPVEMGGEGEAATRLATISLGRGAPCRSHRQKLRLSS